MKAQDNLTQPDVHTIDVPPDWVCEVLSESKEAHDRVTKRWLYASHGVAHYWIVDPEARTVEALTLEGGRWMDAAPSTNPRSLAWRHSIKSSSRSDGCFCLHNAAAEAA